MTRDAAMTAEKPFHTAAAIGLSGDCRDRVKYFKSG
jgi:hypothetical protein